MRRERNRLLELEELRGRGSLVEKRQREGKGGFGMRGSVVLEVNESRGAGWKGSTVVLVRTSRRSQFCSAEVGGEQEAAPALTRDFLALNARRERAALAFLPLALPTMATLSIIAQPGKTAPTPYGPLAFAYSVAGAATAPKVTFVHSLPADAQATQLDING